MRQIIVHRGPAAQDQMSTIVSKACLAGWRFGFISTNNDLMRRSTKLYETPPLVSLRLYPRAARMLHDVEICPGKSENYAPGESRIEAITLNLT